MNKLIYLYISRTVPFFNLKINIILIIEIGIQILIYILYILNKYDKIISYIFIDILFELQKCILKYKVFKNKILS